MTVTEVAADRSLRAEVTEFIKGVFEAEDTVSVEKLVRMAHKYFNGDEWVREALIREGLNSLIPDLAGDVRHKLRLRARDMGTPETRRSRIASVFESVGDGYSKSVLSMTKPEHLFAATQREIAAAGHLRFATFHRAVAKLHKDNVTPTGALPTKVVEDLWKKHIERD
jgi:hypothetical protein